MLMILSSIYVTDDTGEVDRCILKAQHYARDIRVWMIGNCLKNNAD